MVMKTQRQHGPCLHPGMSAIRKLRLAVTHHPSSVHDSIRRSRTSPEDSELHFQNLVILRHRSEVLSFRGRLRDAQARRVQNSAAQRLSPAPEEEEADRRKEEGRTKEQGRATGESDWYTSGVANQCDMAITNGNTWLVDMVEDISGKIEEFCLDVEDCICTDTVHYVESKLKKVRADMRSFCLKFVQEVFTSSPEQASEEVLSDMPPLEITDSYTTSDPAEGDYLQEDSCSINNYSDVDSESWGDSTQDVPISQAEETPLKFKDGHKRASLMEGLGEDVHGLDTCADNIGTVKSLYCVSPEEHVSIIPDVTSSNAFVEPIAGSDCSVSRDHHCVNELIKLDESCIIVDAGELCSAPNEMTEARVIQNFILENMASTMRNHEFDESEWEII
ncbi:uncharacterized protein LOC125314099 [Rhodamnia argentea]|uniref:Uncharacterized protein LOC125314099 n=1 Tax=Rhodamnia argentea TaxID=178133 RepID=A0ABM3H4K0_9MYRT|nr:uncharacterized protein LOC125314099 [Rhodamnia argentea]